MDIKNMHEMIEKLVSCAKSEIDMKGIEKINTEEMGKVTDMIKDIAEAQYYRTLVVAMEETEYGEDYDEDGPIENKRYYRGQRRSKRTGRYIKGYDEMRPWDYDDMEHMRDMDYHKNRMYYAGNGSGNSGNYGGNGENSGNSTGNTNSAYYGGNSSRDYREGNSGRARKGYVESKELHKGKEHSMKELENYMRELANDVTGMIHDATPEEKNMLKAKLDELKTKIN